jgi:dTDP-4-amino-4,6-dideoxygalactose transaminase
MIPLVDLSSQYLSIKDEIDSTIRSCISDASFIKGKVVTDFENDFADYIGSDYCIGCGNGTDALEIIMASLGIGVNDEVIVPALSWIATAEAVNNVGAEPVFVDIAPDNFTIDVSKIEAKIGPKTRAIIPVHLYGCPCDMSGIETIAMKYGLFIIEDCAQAHGAEFDGKKIGSFGIASAFSFFPSKNLGAFGDAGAIVTSNKNLADTARRISNHGQLNIKHSHSLVGRNSRLDSIQAAVLKVKLKYLDEWNEKRINIAKTYNLRITGNADLILPNVEKQKKHVFHQYVVRSGRREELISELNKNNISWGIHYPNAIPFLDAYKYKNHKLSDFPISEKATKEVLSLPVYPELGDINLEFICNTINKFIKGTIQKH